MALRCLVFSSNEAMVQPIWQVLADLGVEGEYCASAVDAVERVTTQMFQIVVTDWDDQPEAAFLLKTARDLKAAHRPLTLAIVGDDSKLPEALKAGANSVLVKPIRPEQVRDTMSTACELLRAKQPAAARAATFAEVQGDTPGTAAASAMSAAEFAAASSSFPSFPVANFSPPAFAASSSGAAVAPAPVAPASVTQVPENSFRAGEFLQARNSAPGAQFSTEEREAEGNKSEEQAGADKVEALSELEPMAAAVAEEAAPEAPVETKPEVKEALSGWAALQARLVKTAPAPAKEDTANSELLSFDSTPSFSAAESLPEAGKKVEKREPQPETKSEAELFAYMDGESAEKAAAGPRSRHGRIIFLGVFAAACVVVAVVPRARQAAQTAAQGGLRAGLRWLNPPPVALPQAVPLHDSFGQSGDEYKLPAVGNIPDATTDPSQIRVVPVVDPTAKVNKGADANSGTAQTPAGESAAGEQNSPVANPGEAAAPDANGVAPGGGQSQSEDNPQKNTPAPTVVERTPNPVVAAVALPVVPPEKTTVQSAPPPAPPVQRPTTPRTVTVASNAGIPSSLRTQMASSTPEASGNKPPEAAMSSIEPVPLKEPAMRDLLVQQVEPEYPASARGQRGSVTLQVMVGRDGMVQDAKFLQGSLAFAKVAIDAVKQWKFKPYSMNGRAVAVQSVITLTFKPLA